MLSERICSYVEGAADVEMVDPASADEEDESPESEDDAVLQDSEATTTEASE